jgi:tight adherence protein C
MTNLALLLGLVCIATAIVLAVFLLTKRAEPAPKHAADAPAELVGAGGVISASGLPAVPPGYGVATIDPNAPYGPPGNVPPPPAYATIPELPPLMQRLRQLALRLSPSGYGQWLRRRLDLAGNPTGWPADRVLAFKGAGLVGGLVLGGLLGVGHGFVLVLLALGGAAVFFFLPDILVYNTGEKRQRKLLNGLPDALDMMTVCVEAGLGFDAALSRVAIYLEGPIAVECARVLQEMQFGLSRSQALRSFADRSNVPEIRSFVSSMVQSSELGISVGLVLREQAKEMRIRRRQRAEEKAQKLQVKIVVPLVLCLLPALFIVVIGPGILNIVHAFGHAHH